MELRIVIKIKHNNAEVLSRATEPENSLAPRSVTIHQEPLQGRLFFRLQSKIKNANDLWSIRRTIDDFIFSISISARTLTILRMYF